MGAGRGGGISGSCGDCSSSFRGRAFSAATARDAPAGPGLGRRAAARLTGLRLLARTGAFLPRRAVAFALGRRTGLRRGLAFAMSGVRYLWKTLAVNQRPTI